MAQHVFSHGGPVPDATSSLPKAGISDDSCSDAFVACCEQVSTEYFIDESLLGLAFHMD
jgi:hypothetical protein